MSTNPSLDTIQFLFRYHQWATSAVWDCVQSLTDDAFIQPMDYAWGSVRGQVVHLIGAQQVWIHRLQGHSPPQLPPETAYPTRDAVDVFWQQVQTETQSFLDGLTPQRLMASFGYTDTKGQAFSHPVGHVLLHVINHSTDHRAQILYMIHRLGGKTVEQDLIFFMRDQPAND